LIEPECPISSLRNLALLCLAFFSAPKSEDGCADVRFDALQCGTTAGERKVEVKSAALFLKLAGESW
jgi:hypothetical protein